MSDEPRKQQSGLSIKTLLIAGASSAIAAFVVPLIWEPGTVFAAASTPIIVAIVTELLKKPAETVSAVRTRKTAGGAVIFEPPPEEPFDPLAPAPTEELETLPQTASEPTVQRNRRRLTPRQWKVALVTGLVAFACAVGVVTATELIAGEQVGSAENPTTFFGGRTSDRGDKRDDDRRKEEATPSPTPSATPGETPTVTPTTTATPTAEASPTPTPAEPAPQSAPPAAPTPAP
ncbi:MAG TPA: hypothetical protein VKA57_06465 [Solirubrobacteraceae bacterium]|nr:hypothetical protein [Solirubrobacteraceae bacterium]